MSEPTTPDPSGKHWIYDQQRMAQNYATQREREDRHGVSPEAILQLGLRDVIVNQVLETWRHGGVSWEGALILMVKTLSQQNKQLVDAMCSKALLTPLNIVPATDYKG